jgi:hypothetical protein
VLDELAATGPHPEHRDAVMRFGRFVGSWDMTVKFYGVDGGLVFDGIGRWDFAWILDGLGVQDVLRYSLPQHSPEPIGARGIGSTIRAYLPGERRWRQVWVAPRAGNFIEMSTVPDDDRLMLVGRDMDGSHLEWEFTNITEDSFDWTGRTSPDGHDGWRVEQRMRGRRCAPAG